MKLLTKAQYEKLLDNGRRQAEVRGTPQVSPVSAYGTDLRLCIKEDLGFVVVTKERK
jgi:hypothetical protein